MVVKVKVIQIKERCCSETLAIIFTIFPNESYLKLLRYLKDTGCALSLPRAVLQCAVRERRSSISN